MSSAAAHPPRACDQAASGYWAQSAALHARRILPSRCWKARPTERRCRQKHRNKASSTGPRQWIPSVEGMVGTRSISCRAKSRHSVCKAATSTLRAEHRAPGSHRARRTLKPSAASAASAAHVPQALCSHTRASPAAPPQKLSAAVTRLAAARPQPRALRRTYPRPRPPPPAATRPRPAGSAADCA